MGAVRRGHALAACLADDPGFCAAAGGAGEAARGGAGARARPLALVAAGADGGTAYGGGALGGDSELQRALAPPAHVRLRGDFVAAS
eukprot:gene10025-biopygen10644